MSINIGGDAHDASYRYKMPKLVTKVEGRGNGIKTVIVNMVDIAKALHCNPAYPTKFFGIELGAQSKFNKKDERAIVNGCHNASDLQACLLSFVEKFILCPTCSLPEIKMKVRSGNIKIDCAACGHNGILPTNHRLVTYIVKNPPKGKKDKDKKNKKDRKKDRKKKGKDKDKREEEEDSGEEEVEKPKKSKKEKKDKKDKTSKKSKKADEEVEWFTDISAEAQAKRKEAEFSEMKSDDATRNVQAIMESAKADNATDSALTVFKVFLAQKKRSPSAVVGELKRLQLARAMDNPQKFKVALEGLIDVSKPKEVAGQFTTHAGVFALLAEEQPTVLLGCIENLVGSEDALRARTPLILQALYDNDVLDEDVILAWAASPPESSWLVNKEVAVFVRAKAQPFIEWLKNAESDDEDSDEE
jgi:translation initiation factor 5